MNDLQLDNKSDNSLRIMLVDDHPQVRTVLAMGMEIDGHQVIQCVDGKEAISAFETLHPNSPDILILDYGLPGINGVEVAKQIRNAENGSHVVIALLTGTDSSQIRQEANAAGIEHFLNKPISLKRLNEWLQELQLNPSEP